MKEVELTETDHGSGSTRRPDVEAIRRRLDLIERFIVQSPRFTPAARDVFLPRLRSIRGRLHDGMAEATVEKLDDTWSRILRMVTDFVARPGGPAH